MLTQEKAKYLLYHILGRESSDVLTCSGHSDTCPNDECMLCSVRDCPFFEPLHYHHDGCPCCYYANSNTELPNYDEFIKMWTAKQ